MRIAVSCKENRKDADVDERFGRAPCFCIYDTDSDSFEFINNNQAYNSPSGAGVQAAQHIVESDVSALLTGHCGPKAFRALSAAEIKIYINVSGTLQEAIEAFKKGELTSAENADVEGHW